VSFKRRNQPAGEACGPAGTSPGHRVRTRYSVRLWSVRHARFLEYLYTRFADVLVRLHKIFDWIGYKRIERPVLFVERNVKGLLFDCRMCGQCILSSTGMSCPMNCPKTLRNGPCGGVRANGHCEVEPDMPCVWVQGWRGSRTMRDGDAILDVQPPVDQSSIGASAWLRETSVRAADKSTVRELA
jgi:methylene-tetrahydrofolate reductase-like protein